MLKISFAISIHQPNFMCSAAHENSLRLGIPYAPPTPSPLLLHWLCAGESGKRTKKWSQKIHHLTTVNNIPGRETLNALGQLLLLAFQPLLASVNSGWEHNLVPPRSQ